MPHMSLTTCYLMKITCMHVLDVCAWVYNLFFFRKKPTKHKLFFCQTYPAVVCNLCRTNLALSDISCVFWSFLSDTSSCGHIWPCRTYLAGTSPSLVVLVKWFEIPLLCVSSLHNNCVRIAFSVY